MIVLVRARASLPELRWDEVAYVSENDPRWARRIASGRVEVLERVDDDAEDDPEDDAEPEDAPAWLAEGLTVDETLVAVGDDPTLAREALAAEHRRDTPRATLIDALTRVVER